MEYVFADTLDVEILSELPWFEEETIVLMLISNREVLNDALLVPAHRLIELDIDYDSTSTIIL